MSTYSQPITCRLDCVGGFKKQNIAALAKTCDQDLLARLGLLQGMYQQHECMGTTGLAATAL